MCITVSAYVILHTGLDHANYLFDKHNLAAFILLRVFLQDFYINIPVIPIVEQVPLPGTPTMTAPGGRNGYETLSKMP
jgi:hypothetical protein